jgi:hypothetical protein
MAHFGLNNTERDATRYDFTNKGLSNSLGLLHGYIVPEKEHLTLNLNLIHSIGPLVRRSLSFCNPVPVTSVETLYYVFPVEL